jgi:hypothetical protein
LIKAAIGGHAEVVSLLLDRGANVEAVAKVRREWNRIEWKRRDRIEWNKKEENGREDKTRE